MKYTVQAGDTLSGIAKKFGVTVSQLQEWNGISDPNLIQIGQSLIVGTTSNKTYTLGGSTYVVQAGDALSLIAEKFGVTVAQLQTWNNISDPNSIQIGQILQINGNNSSVTNAGSSTYVVQAGDALSLIAERFGVTVAQLQQWNGISDPNLIQVGQVLQVGGNSSTVSGSNTYTVQAGDALSLIAERFGVTVAQLQQWNGISDPNLIQVGQVLQVGGNSSTAGGGSSYIVQAGDALSLIAERFGVTVAQLQQWNGISNPNLIQVGQVLNIGGKSTSGYTGGGTSYVVQAGDALSLIAEHFGVTVSQLQEWNGITDPNFIQIGQVLHIGGGAENWFDSESGRGTLVQSTEGLLTDLHGKYVSAHALNYIGWANVTQEDLDDLNYCLTYYGITTEENIRHFISQCSHESGCGKWREELATGDAYEGRADLGNIYPGDGRKFKGGGYIQMTGRANYTRFAEAMKDSEIVNQGVSYVARKYPWTSAGFWWFNNGMISLINDNPNISVEEVTLRVNGGYNGLESRKYYYSRACKVIDLIAG